LRQGVSDSREGRQSRPYVPGDDAKFAPSFATIEEMKTGISDSGLNLTQEKFLNLSLPKLNLEQQQTTCAASKPRSRARPRRRRARERVAPLAEARPGHSGKGVPGELISQNSTEGET